MILGLERSPGEGMATHSSVSCLENSMDRGAGWAAWGHKELGMTEGLTLFPLSLTLV